jgi:hypothetical protein
MGLAFPVPSARLIHVLDAAVLVWVAAWITLALLVGREVRDLRELSDTVVVAGIAVEDTADLVDSLGSIPFVGDRVGNVADQVRAAGRSAQASGQDSRDSTENLAVLLALSIGLIPTLPLLGLYAPLRISWTREARAVRRAVAVDPSDPVLLRFLANRALLNLPFQEVTAVSPDPFRDLDEGRVESLANRELRRLGLNPSTVSAAAEPSRPPVPLEEPPE